MNLKKIFEDNYNACYKSDKIMNLIEAQELTKGKLGLTVKKESDGVLIYANAWTLIADIGKWIKFKLN